MRLLCAALCLILGAGAGAAEDAPTGKPGDFDFYVLALSWSPTYCANNADDAAQCSEGKARAFVVHGLWPQYEEGWPQFCAEKRRPLPRHLADSMLDIMPSRRLVYAQWDKHGTCSGLSAADYFAKTRRAGEIVRVPAEFERSDQALAMSAEAIEAAFIRANPGLRSEMLAIDCDARALAEIRICLDKDLRFRSCPEVDRKACTRRSISVPAQGGL